MIRHIFIAAWRNMLANRLISAIAILGLAVGIAAAMLMGLVIRNQTRFDHFISGHERTYRAITGAPRPGSCADGPTACMLDYRTVAFFKLNVPAVESATRLAINNTGPMKLQHGNVTAWDTLYWADPNVFDVLPLPVLYGDLRTALARPEGIVLTRAMAEKYFGREDAVGDTLTLDSHPMVVRAVIADLPAHQTELRHGIFASALAAFSKIVPVTGGDAEARARKASFGTIVYMRLKPGASVAEVEKQATHWQWTALDAETRALYIKVNERMDVHLLRLDRIGLSENFVAGIGERLTAASLAGVLVLFIAAVNFINLMVARAARREREVGVRKACGAGRAALVLQFLGEAMIAVALGTCIALAASEWLLPAINAFLQTGARLDVASDPAILPFLLLSILVLGLGAGAYPAFVLSAFTPATVLRGWTVSAARTGAIRNVLVTLQFAILIVLAISAGVIWQQRNYATREALRADTDQMLLIRTPGGPGPGFEDMTAPGACPAAFRDEVRKLPGVSGLVCSDSNFLGAGGIFLNLGPAVQADAGLLALYGIKPVAGILPPYSSANGAPAMTGVVLNVSAVRKLGFASPQAAIGHSPLPRAFDPQTDSDWFDPKHWGRHAIINAVVPDFSFASVKQPVQPALFSPWMSGNRGRLIHIKLNGHQIPETLAAIKRLWVTTDQPGPLDQFFLNDYMQQLYQDMTQEAQFFAAIAVVAMILACMGLVGIAVSTAERRTKEIGVRKAMGAGDSQIVALLLWQFAQPVLWANVIAWPVAWWLMRRWLSGFAYHIDLHWWVFAAASLGALLIALLTVAGQAWMTARQKPVLALRYE